MLNDINLKEAPAKAGAYLFISNDEVVYIGSSKNLYQRMVKHRNSIKKGSAEHGYQANLYQFLQSNQFTVEFQLTDNYKQIEQELIEKHNPKFNSHRAYTGVGAFKGREAEYDKEYKQKFKEERKQYQKQYNNQHCNYNGETLSLAALSMRFRAKGIEHPQVEAKKYLIQSS